ncbi:MAG: hypothetical protein HZA46_04355 [Planctomycetales bacterium]|nr:hypothetical protein [Planctomycetales bacterium]
MSKKRSVLLVFDDHLHPRVVGDGVPLPDKHENPSTLKLMMELARRALPQYYWQVSGFDSYKAALDKFDTEKDVALVVADLWAIREKGGTPVRDKTDNARNFATFVKSKAKGKFAKEERETIRCVIVSTLPEDNPHYLRRGMPNPGDAGSQGIDEFWSLAHFDVSPWDELYNVLVNNACRILFDEHRAHLKGNHGFKQTEKAAIANGSLESVKKTAKQPVSINDELIKKPSPKGMTIKNCCFGSTFLLEHTEFDRLTIEDCTFEGPVLIRSNEFRGPLQISRCRFFGPVFVLNNQCHDDTLVIYNDFAPSLKPFPEEATESRVTAYGDEVKVDFTKHAMPWFSKNRFYRRFSFSGNYGVPSYLPIDLPETGFARTLMFNRCRFEGRVRIDSCAERTKLTFYACGFKSGRYFEINFPFISKDDRFPEDVPSLPNDPEVADETPYQRPSDIPWRQNDKNCDKISALRPSAFRFRGPDFPPDGGVPDRRDVDLRLTQCDLAGRIVIREYPWRTELYDPRFGLAINLTGSTLTGTINLRNIRVRWLNLDRASVLGGAVFASKVLFNSFVELNQLSDNPSKSTSRTARFVLICRSLLKKVFVNPFQHLLNVPPSYGGPVFAEREFEGHEQTRFSSYVWQANDLIEFKGADKILDVDVLRADVCRRIAQQYDDLRKAFANAPNSYWNDDFCHYKSMYFSWLRECYLDRRGGLRTFVVNRMIRQSVVSLGILWGLAFCFLLVFARYFPANGTAAAWHSRHLMVPVIVLPIVLVLFGREAIRRFTRRVVYLAFRLFLGFGVYPQRIVISSIFMILFYGVLYWAASGIADPYDKEWLGSIQIPSDLSGEWISQSYGSLWYCIYFSMVTFATLGYGDFTTRGALSWIAAGEALIGGFMMSMIALGVAGRFLRR